MWVISVGGGGVILCIFLLLDAVFLYYRDILSVAKLKNSFWSAAGCAGYYVAFSHSLTWVEKYINICHESCFESVLMLFLLGVGECYFCYCWLWLVFLDVLVYLCCLMNRDIWWGIFEVLFVPPAEYLNLVCILSYLLVSRFSLAYCRAICFFALVKI